MSEVDPQGITPPPALGPPIIGTDPGSVPGQTQPVFTTGSATSPTAASFFPTGTTDTWLPPPQVGMGNNQPYSTLVVPAAPVPPSTAGFTQPQYKTGSGTSPTAASLFPAFTAAGASPAIVLNATQKAGEPYPVSPPAAPPAWIKPPALPLPTTPGIAPIVISSVPTIPQLAYQVPPVILTPPVISGSSSIGATMTCTTGVWQNNPTSYAYQWYSSGNALPGETNSTHVITSSDHGHPIFCTVTATNATGSETAISNTIKALAADEEVTQAKVKDVPPKPAPKAKPKGGR